MSVLKGTNVLTRNLEAWADRKYRRALNEGGTSSSKTWSILQLLTMIASEAKSNFLISVVSESMPHLRRGVMRDFMNIMEDSFDDSRWNKSNSVYTFGRGKIEFFSADQPSKLRGGRRKILFINECNNVNYDAYREMDIRTELFTFLDWNPVSEFWVHENGLINKPENAYIHSTYLDAASVLPEEVVKNIESNKDSDPNWWNIYGLGLLGKIEGLVYPKFEQCDMFPYYQQKEFYGLDFGYSNDPTALVRCVIDDDKLFSEELIYEKGMSNDAIAHRMDELGIKRNNAEIFADSADPKSIAEIHKYGFNVKPCPKGADSAEFGHQKVRQYKQLWTKKSLNGIKEQRNFRYVEDLNGKLTSRTTHSFSHLMDARRYAVMGMAVRVRHDVLWI